MKSLTLLLIPIILVSSCSIDWNDEKDKNQNFSQPTQIQKMETWATIIEYPKPQTTTWTLIKDFWSGFTLSQTDDETILVYSGKTIKTWSHTPPKNVPFVWDEACIDFFEAMEIVSPKDREKNKNWKQAIWDRFDENNKKQCMKEYLWKNLEVFASTMRFFEIRKIQYEGWDTWIYDIKTGNIQELQTLYNSAISWSMQIIESASWITLLIEMWYGDTDTRLIYNPDFSELLSKEEIPKQ